MNDERFMYVITWDIKKNMEHNMMEIELKNTKYSGH